MQPWVHLVSIPSRSVNRLLWWLKIPTPPYFCAGLFLSAPVFRVVFFPNYGNYAREGMELIFSVAFLAAAFYAAWKPSLVWVRPAPPVGREPCVPGTKARRGDAGPRVD